MRNKHTTHPHLRNKVIRFSSLEPKKKFGQFLVWKGNFKTEPLFQMETSPGEKHQFNEQTNKSP